MSFRNTAVYKFAVRVKAMEAWRARGFNAPSPAFVKHACLLRNGISGATWVETGTYVGETTDVLASAGARMVHSLEPDPDLYGAAKRRFSDRQNVHIYLGTSEEILPALLPTLTGDICFWLDGHFSGEGTHRGPFDTPILKELETVAAHLERWQSVAVMIDDMRLFNGEIHSYGAYPRVEVVAEWARSNGMRWHIEHDMLIARRDARATSPSSGAATSPEP
jgi:hypothetical protein